MTYVKTVWKNREVENPRTFNIQNNPDGTITLIPAEGEIIEAGTPIIAANMNNIEQGIKDAHDAIGDAASQEEFNAHLVDYTYQTPIIVGTQIRILKQSNTNRLYFKLDNDLTGTITISLDNGVTSLPLLNVNGEPVTELEKGFVEVVKEGVNFTLRPRGASLNIDALISEYEIEAGENINAGDLVEFINNKAKKASPPKTLFDMDTVIIAPISLNIEAVEISENIILIAYRNNEDYKGFMRLLTIDGTNITNLSNDTVVESNSINGVSLKLVKLEENKVLVMYREPYIAKARIITVNGSIISVGAAVTINNDNTYIMSGSLIKDNTVLALFNDQSSGVWRLSAKIITINGMSITSSTTTVIDSNVGSSLQELQNPLVIQQNKVVIFYTTVISPDVYLKGKVLSIDGLTLIVGELLDIDKIHEYSTSADLISLDTLILSYSNNGYGIVRLLNVIGETLSFKNNPVSLDYGVDDINIIHHTNNEFLFICRLHDYTQYTRCIYRVFIKDDLILVDKEDLRITGLVSVKVAPISLSRGILLWVDRHLPLPNFYSKMSFFYTGRKSLADGLALESGVGGETKKFYDWRYPKNESNN